MPIDLNNVEWEEVKVDPVNVVWDDPPAPEFPAVQNQYVDSTKTGESLAYSTLLNIVPEQAYLNHDELKQAFSNQMDSKPMSGAGGDFAVDPPRNPLEEIDAAIRAGGIGALENYARTARVAGMDTTDLVNRFTIMGEPWAPSRSGTAWHSIYGGFRGATESIVTAIPGAALGSIVGTQVPVVGTAAGALTGFVLGPGVVFSFAEYDRFLEEIEQLGLSREAHKGKAVISAVAEGGIEALTNLAGAKIFGFIGKGALSEPVKQGLMQAFGRFLGRVGMVQSVEVPGEMATAAIQNNQRRKAGIDTGMTDWEAAKSAAGPAFVQGLLMGGAFQAGRGLRPGEVQPTQPIDQGERVEPVVTVAEEMPVVEEIKPIEEPIPITKPITDEAIYEENRQASKRVAVQETKKALVETKRSVGKLVDELLGPISTRIGIISPKVKNTLKRFEYDYRMQIKKDTIAVKPILERSSKEMTPEDFADFDLARKNSDTTKIMELLTKYNLFDEYKTLRKTLDAVRKRAKEVGYDVNFIEDYHPRVLKDPEGFLEYFQKGKDWDIISRAIKEREDESGKMSPEEKAQFVNSLIQGYQHGQAKPSSFKGRTIQMIDAKLNQFYMSSHGALTAYIRQTNEAIEAKRFFGKGEKATDFTHVEDSIGAYVIGEIAEGNIRPDQEAELTKILRARFEARGPGKVIGTLRDLAYIDVMGSPISAITQIGDLTWALYKYGLESTGKGVWNALKGKPLLSKEDIGIEGIVQEFEDPSRASDLLRTVFKLTGLEKIDRIGKEALIETTIRDYQARAKKDAAALKKELKPIFGKETNQVIKDLQTGELSENVGYLGFSRLLDFQPVALSEMPETYLRTTNGRIFYMLKTFTIKQFDIFRREAFQKIKSKNPETVKEGLRNLVVLSSIFVLLNATADEIKDFILGRKTSFKDRLIDNIFRLFGVSKFITWTARMEGWGTALLKQMLPPMQFVNSLASGDPKKLLKSIPFVGKIFYWRTKEEKPKKGRRKSTRRKPE